MDQDFLSVDAHFDALLALAPAAVRKLYKEHVHTRVETAFAGRHFTIYRMDGRKPLILDRIMVNDVEARSADGITSEIISLNSNQVMTLDFTPRQVFGHDVLAWVPLHAKLRWGAVDATGPGSLAYPLCIRTSSRLHLRERGVTYMETGPAFGAEFN